MTKAMLIAVCGVKFDRETHGETVTARFGENGVTICDPNRVSEGADKVFEKIYDRAL